MIPDRAQFVADFDPHGSILCDLAESASHHRDTRAEALRLLLQQLPDTRPSHIGLDQDRIAIGRASDLSAARQTQLERVLLGLKPWRKGPFDLFGIAIESEWNSALKWRRVAPHMAPLQDRRVLDVGSSNGYYLLRMATHHPRLVLGIEPYAAYFHQFAALHKYLQLPGIYCLPLKLEDLLPVSNWFDTVFCMGMLYHRRSPLDTLVQLKNLMTQNGQLILETLIIEGDRDLALSPRGRYARMRNVYFIPTVKCLRNWMERCGFKNIRCVDITATTSAEQRKTSWIDSDSLDSFLDPHDDRLTLEGYPAPVRAVVIAHAE